MFTGALERTEIRNLRGLRQLHVRRISGNFGISGVGRVHVCRMGRRFRQVRRLLLAAQRHGPRYICVFLTTVRPFANNYWFIRRPLAVLRVYFVRRAEPSPYTRMPRENDAYTAIVRTTYKLGRSVATKIASVLFTFLPLAHRLQWIRLPSEQDWQGHGVLVQLAGLPDVCRITSKEYTAGIIILIVSCESRVQDSFDRNRNVRHKFIIFISFRLDVYK